MYCWISHEKACLYQFGGRPVQCGLRACADLSGRAYRQIVYIVYPLNLKPFEREGRGASDSLVRGWNRRQGVFHDYSHLFVL